jgi:septation ring formation regulator EzrA
MSNYPTDSTPINLPRLEKEIDTLIYWFDSLDADKKKNYSAKMDEIKQSIEEIRKNGTSVVQDYVTRLQDKVNYTAAAVSALSKIVIPLIAELKNVRGDQVSGGRRRIKKRTRRHKKKRGKKTRGKKTRKL